jgi:hypothetical protein
VLDVSNVNASNDSLYSFARVISNRYCTLVKNSVAWKGGTNGSNGNTSKVFLMTNSVHSPLSSCSTPHEYDYMMDGEYYSSSSNNSASCTSPHKPLVIRGTNTSLAELKLTDDITSKSLPPMRLRQLRLFGMYPVALNSQYHNAPSTVRSSSSMSLPMLSPSKSSTSFGGEILPQLDVNKTVYSKQKARSSVPAQFLEFVKLY